MCDLIVESTYGDDVETSGEYIHEYTLVEVDLSDTFLYSLFSFDDMYAIVENMSCSLCEAYKKWECCLDTVLWPLFSFDPGAKYRIDDVGAPKFLLDLHDKQSNTFGESHNQILCASFIELLIFDSKDLWLY